MYIEVLSVHRDSLDTLELAIRDDGYRDFFNNLGTTLERGRRLEYLAAYFFGIYSPPSTPTRNQREDTSIHRITSHHH
ncbi:hypothetical protein K457DRAFT_17391 [Linnemannia elongata AG-77]|uniref:Uncharacterized protein n=1 Tax=Linnemannia elongata AG-77 TaxID=1314771 RepID=A0A197K1C3_9FUNG|nr:hypothetical protein K457DRAFT_17391 [Linnemannia elongata AG-77]